MPVTRLAWRPSGGFSNGRPRKLWSLRVKFFKERQVFYRKLIWLMGLAPLCLLPTACNKAEQSGRSDTRADAKSDDDDDDTAKKKGSANSKKSKSKGKSKDASAANDGAEAAGEGDTASSAAGETRADADPDPEKAALASPCQTVAELGLTGFEKILPSACSGADLGSKAKALIAQPFKGSATLTQGTHYTASEVGEDTEFVAQFASHYATTCEKFVSEAGPKVMAAPKNVSFFGASVSETTKKTGDIEAQGGNHLGGETYQANTEVSGFVSKSDTFSFKVDVYGADGGLVSVEQTTKPGVDMRFRYLLSFLLDQKDGSCIGVSFLHMKMGNDGMHDTAVDDILVPGLTGSITTALTEAGKLK